MFDDIQVGDELPGGFVVLTITATTIVLQGPSVAGVPTQIAFDRAQFESSFLALLRLLGIEP